MSPVKDTVRILKFELIIVFKIDPEIKLIPSNLVFLSAIMKFLIQTFLIQVFSSKLFSMSHTDDVIYLQKRSSKSFGNKILETKRLKLYFDHWTILTIQIPICVWSSFSPRLSDDEEMSIWWKSFANKFLITDRKNFRFFVQDIVN